MDHSSRPLALVSCLSLPGHGVVTVYGAGGKTSVMETLGRELTAQGKRVIQTTTTKIFRPEDIPVVIGEDWQTISEQLRRALEEHGSVVLGATLLPDNKLSGIDPAWPEALLNRHIADYVIVEADGSARKPIKGYAPHEPVFPTRSDLLMPVLGIEAIGKPVNPDYVHRTEAFCQLTGARPNEPVAVGHFLKSMQYMIGLGRSVSPEAPIIPLVNKVDLISDVGLIREISQEFRNIPKHILFTVLKEEDPVRFVFRDGPHGSGFDISVVVLAAGGAVRMGRPKLSLELQGKTLLDNALLPIGKSGFRDVVVVLSEENEGLQDRLPAGYRVVINRHSKEGIATSLKTGVAAVDPCSQGILFVLGDQPFVGVEVYEKLTQYHRYHLPLLTWPVYRGKRGNPVLFDRRLWPALLQTEGDEGGKQIILTTPDREIGRVDVADPGILIDIDTPEEYEKYRTEEKPQC